MTGSERHPVLQRLVRKAEQAYVRLLNRPGWLLVGLTGALLLAAGYASRFSFDASADTLVVQDDPDLALYREISAVFGGDDFLLVTFTPHDGPLLSMDNVRLLAELQERLGAIEGVTSVFSVLDAPLLQSPPVPLDELAEGFRTLLSPDTDRALAIEELSGSPFFRELLISADGRTAALRVELIPLPVLERENTAERRRQLAERAALIEAVRGVRAEFSDRATLHLGGVPMIAADMIAFVKSDLAVFGGLVLVLVMAVLYAAFRQVRWVVLPLGAAAASIVATMGALGFLYKPATVISSNFVALLAIMTISLNIHLIVRYRELAQAQGADSVRELVAATMTSKFSPCLYTALTTMAAFGSLTASNIVPVEDFGLMMCIGVLFALLIAFTLFPAVLMLLPRGRPKGGHHLSAGLVAGLSRLAVRRSGAVGAVAVAALVLTAAGVAQLSVDNRFIDYFKDDTDINQGMVYIDQHLGGTAPFDVVLSFEPWRAAADDFFDDFGDGDLFADEAEQDPFPERYWFTRDKLDRIRAVHRYLEARPEVGKVVSLASLDDLAMEFTGGNPLNNVQIAAVLAALPPNLREEIIRPYAAPASGQARLWERVIESGPYFDREALVTDIKRHAAAEVGFGEDNVAVAGMVVLFNAMVQKLVTSQVDTLGYVLLATFAMFLVLLRSPLFALLGLVPNVLAAAAVLAVMGFAGISLDMMTTAIAAVSVGIGVDFAIHYLHRYRVERALVPDAGTAIVRTHGAIGRALFLTGVTIMVGFSVLCFSNFVPTILFGLLVALAMALAFLANLTLLPSLLKLTDRFAHARSG
ncbi:MAG: MMPL family transporter [Gammaproteobacteria bacterium]|nr:MMPL family transporter [Gammaproteobacteria bacterium]